MSDITMCKGADCPRKMSCYRFLAKPHARQSWFALVPYKKEEDHCEYFAQATLAEKEAYKKRLKEEAL